MTNAEQILKQVIEKKELISQLRNQFEELESELLGMEIKYKGNYAVIEYIDAIDGEVTLYVEDNDENSWNEMISIYELIEII